MSLFFPDFQRIRSFSGWIQGEKEVTGPHVTGTEEGSLVKDENGAPRYGKLRTQTGAM